MRPNWKSGQLRTLLVALGSSLSTAGQRMAAMPDWRESHLRGCRDDRLERWYRPHVDAKRVERAQRGAHVEAIIAMPKIIVITDQPSPMKSRTKATVERNETSKPGGSSITQQAIMLVP